MPPCGSSCPSSFLAHLLFLVAVFLSPTRCLPSLASAANLNKYSGSSAPWDDDTVDEPSPSSVGCPAISVFPFWLRRQCPVLEDTRCANGFPSDVPAPPGQLNCALASAQRNARLRQLSARELLTFTKRRDPFGRPLCMLTLFYSPDCVFSAKVADTLFRAALLLPKLRVVAVDVSVGGKGTESLISHYGISSTPVIALWQDGFPRYRLYDDYARLDTLLRVLRSHTDLSTQAESSPAHPSTALGNEQTKMAEQQQQTNDEQPQQQQQHLDDDSSSGIQQNGGEEQQQGIRHSQWEPTRDEFLAQFHYLKEHLGFDWYLFAAAVTCLVNCVYFLVSSQKGRALLRRHFPHHFAAVVLY